MYTSLAPQQKADIVRFVLDDVGAHADFAMFSACLFDLFEDIPGFEAIAPSDALIRELWGLFDREK